MIEIGDYVIINDMDRPCSKLIAEIVGFDEGYARAKYLSKNTCVKECLSQSERMTNIKDFGVEILFNTEKFASTQTGESIAKYPNGEPRNWQPEGNDSIQPLRKWKRKELKK